MKEENDWKNNALELAKNGYSWRRIAKYLGVPKSTVSDYLREAFRGVTRPPNNKGYLPIGEDIITPCTASGGLTEAYAKDSGPRILLYDIETSPILARVWSLWDQNVGLNQIKDDWFLLSFSAKWLGEDEVFYYDQSEAEDIEDDYEILLKLWDLLNECDVAIGHNLKRFDTKKVNARFILNGLPKPGTYRQIDTLEIAKRQFGFTSSKLEYLTETLCSKYKKLKHKKFPGFLLWSECLKGNPEAWKEMKEYNIHDVLSLEELYNIFSSWDDRLPNFDVYVDHVLDMDEWEHDGYHYTNLGKYKKYRNKLTGVQRRSRVNELTKEKRGSLLANIV